MAIYILFYIKTIYRKYKLYKIIYNIIHYNDYAYLLIH